ncbi:hypothetical protein [Sphingopyxis sp. 2PD]|uniref:hypothetical protein n=1 Tax=Sphingopyxis sp. 2PD TaxID=2502196 RepID=UPI0010F930B1|nr:hypothetical protein [Sphingopyxis sp. 2PD]
MRISLSVTAAIAAMTFFTSVAQAEAVKPVQAEQIEQLCPGLKMTELSLGLPRSQQNTHFLKQVNRLPEAFAPFTEADVEFTPWSGLLAGITYLGVSPDGDVNQSLAAALESSLLAAGWTTSERTDFASPLGFNSQYFSKEVETPQGMRELFIEFDTPGALLLRCGDRRLFNIQKREYEGELEPGSKRPRQPLAANKDAKIAAESDCDDILLLEAFGKAGIVDETSPAFADFIAGGASLSAYENYKGRIVTWLKWSLLDSKRIDRDRMWKLEDEAGRGRTEQTLAAIGSLLEAVAQVGAASEEGDSKAVCKSFVGVMRAQADADRRKIAYHEQITKLLEQEAARVGLNLESDAG